MRTREFKYNVGDIVNESLLITSRYRDLKYKDGREKNTLAKYYNYKCTVCEYEDSRLESNMLKGNKCRCCTNQIIIPNINSIMAKEELSWMVEYFYNKDDCYKYSKQCNESVKMICPECKTTKKMKISNLYNKGFSCSVCGDCFSFGEKLIRELLLYIKEPFKVQHKFDGFNKKYDFYLKKSGEIIEVHGEQHYYGSMFDKDLEYQRKNDMFKYDIAVLHGYEYNKNYFVINYSKRDIFILFDEVKKIKMFSKISFNTFSEIYKKSHNSILLIVCETFNRMGKGVSASVVAKKLNLSKGTVATMLKRGNELGMCEYNPSEFQGLEKRKRKIECYKDGMLIGEFNSIAETVKKINIEFGVKLIQSSITLCCQNKQKLHKGYEFKYK